MGTLMAGAVDWIAREYPQTFNKLLGLASEVYIYCC
jgi:hypothetical protein